jgi:hypothetical protein
MQIHTGNQGGNYILRAIYTDKGGPVVGSLTASDIVIFRNPKVEAEDFVIGQENEYRSSGWNEQDACRKCQSFYIL